MQIGFVGLGKMGGNMVHRIERDSDHEVVAFDPNPDAVKAAEGHGAIGAASLEELVSKLEAPRIVWLMVPSGKITEGTIEALTGLLEDGDTIVDGGNSNWHDDQRRAKELEPKGIRYADVGISGGVWGLEVGYCMMAGGPDESIAQLAPILDVLAPPDGWRHFGPSGAGHFVKMVHNGVEYGMMQAYAEGFDLMHQSPFPIELKEVAGLWNRGSVVRSWLCELAEKAFEQEGNDLKGLQGYVDDSGEGRWMMNDGIEMAVPTPALAASLYARFYSRKEGDYAARVLAALRNQFGGHAVKKTETNGGGRQAGPSGSGREPADRGARAPAGPRDDADDLRRHRRSRPPQAAARALQPRPRGRAARALQPRRRRPARDVRRGVPRGGQDRDREVLAPRDRRHRARGPARPHALRRLLLRRRRGLRPALEADRPARRGGRRQAQPRLLPLDRAGVLPDHRRRAQDVRAQLRRGRRRPLHHREAVRRRPRVRARAAARRRARLPRAAGLPHRPLPGQGDRPERDGVPVRELHVRADLEPQLHRPHPDHRGRGPRDRLARRLLRPGRRPARPGPEPHAAAADAGLHGAARLLRGRQGPRREGQGPAGDHAADARGGPPRHGPRAVRRRRRGRRGGPRLPRGGRRPGRLAHRDLRRAAPGGPQLALGRRADLPAHRQAPHAQGHRDRGPAQAGAAPGLPVARARSASSPTSSC